MPPTPARHHAEWLSLVEISGPFLSMPVLLSAFPQGLDDFPPAEARSLRADYEYWQENRAQPAVHTAWVRLVLESMLGYSGQVLRAGQAIPGGLKAEFPEHEETLRPDLLLADPATHKPRLLIQVFPPGQDLDKAPRGSRWQASIGTRMMELLHAAEIRLGLVTNGEQWLLVDAPRGETTGFTTWTAALWFDEPLTLRALRSLLGVKRFFGVPDEETLESLLARSAQDQMEITDQLGLQVRHAVEILIQSLDRADQDQGRRLLGPDVPPALLYEAALTVMMRLVFMLSAEERKLLPIDDDRYAAYYAVSTLREQLQSQADRDGEEVLERRYDAWSRLLAVFRAVHGGIQHQDLHSPAYGGSLFDPQRYPFLEGRSLLPSPLRRGAEVPLPINNRTVLHLLDALQMLQVKVPGGGAAEKRRLSFRALDVEQIGHVYEGLLDHQAVRAAEPVLGLVGVKNQEPEVALSAIEKAAAKGQTALLDWLREQTGRGLPALKNALALDLFANGGDGGDGSGRLRSVCGDEVTYWRVLPYAGLIRQDDLGFPVVILPGSVYVTAGTARRATGTHYTPRSLTEPIVQHTLEPLVYEGPAEGLPKEKWRLRGPRELLELKICDMAMGSAGFLVQADRYLSERLVEAWDRLSVEEIPPEVSGLSADDRLVYARRLVAERCLYGVDKNPLAVEIAKLSLWLVTLSKDRPFTFLDHALKCGDSLVGTSEEEFLRWANRKQKSEMSLDQEVLRESLEEARRLRRQIESFTVRDVHDAKLKTDLHQQAEAALAHIKRGADLLVGTRLLGLKAQEIGEMQLGMLDLFLAGELDAEIDPHAHLNAARAVSAAKKERGFHWEFEFPEVFEKGGFTAFIGNPPFLWGNRISSFLSDNYRLWLSLLHPSTFGNADLCGHFFLRSNGLLQKKGLIGFIATNSISETDNRVSFLEPLISTGKTIINAYPDFAWPGSANLHIAIIIMFNGKYSGSCHLNDQMVNRISSFLDSNELDQSPMPLISNSNLSFKGVDTGGLGFVISDEEYEEICKYEPLSKDLIWPFINGEDLLSHPEQKHNRLIINLSNKRFDEVQIAKRIFRIISNRVKPYRDTVKRDRNRENWWLYNEPRPGLYKSITPLSVTLANCVVSKYICFEFLPTRMVFSNALNIFANESFGWFCLLQSTIHDNWARFYGSTLETRNRYNPTDCFETFPFPNNIQNLSPIGEEYHQYRRQIMHSRQEGLTTTYNRFHNPSEQRNDIDNLRRLHVEMDNAVAAAYGWDDLDLGHGFHETAQGTRFTISEPARREVLARLLKLNHERYAEEHRQAGLEAKPPAAGGKKALPAAKAPRGKAAKATASQPRPAVSARQGSLLPGLVPDPEPEIQPDLLPPVESKPPSPSSAIGDWDRAVCLSCGKQLVGFMLKEHTQKVHGGVEPGYRKV